jgi:hypothetical protein
MQCHSLCKPRERAQLTRAREKLLGLQVKPPRVLAKLSRVRTAVEAAKNRVRFLTQNSERRIDVASTTAYRIWFTPPTGVS